MKKLLALLAFALVFSLPAHAGDVKVKAAVAVDGNTRPATAFPSSTPQLMVFILTEGTEKGDKVRLEWIAEDTNGAAPANYKISNSAYTGDKDNFGGGGSLSKPNSGWPVGKYRVDIYIDDELEGTTKFQITK